MIDGLREFENSAKDSGFRKNLITSNRVLLGGSFTEIDRMCGDAATKNKPKLVLTSPPYPGVHILYHRWQISGRRETPAPYWLADLNDEHGVSHYTMGGRSRLGIHNYFHTLRTRL